MNEMMKTVLAGTVLEMLPPSIARSLIEKSEFTKKYGISVKTTVTLGNEFEFDRAALFSAVRECVASSSGLSTVQDSSQRTWTLSYVTSGSRRSVHLKNDGIRMTIPAGWAFCAGAEDRVKAFEQAAAETFLTGVRYEYWRAALSKRQVYDEEHEQLCRDLEQTLIGTSASIATSFANGTGQIGTLVPRSQEYFAHLVGPIPEGIAFESYVHSSVAEYIERLCNWKPVEGIKHATLLCSHGSISRLIDLDQLTDDNLKDLLGWVRIQGDLISKLAIIEAGLKCQSARPGLIETIESLIEEILADDPSQSSSRFAYLSELIVFTSGEIARTRVLNETPPYWRRLASIAHASLVERLALSEGLDLHVFADALGDTGRGTFFYIQTLVDLRHEPRWLPDLVSANQLKYEFIGRISNAATTKSKKIESPRLTQLLSGKGKGTVSECVVFPYPFLPGPLEGAVPSVTELPPSLVASIEEKLETETLSPSSFAGLINSALIYQIGPNLALIGATALRRAKYLIRENSGKTEIHSLINGLATVAAVTRSTELADEVRTLSRVRRRTSKDIDARSELVIAFVAAASHSEVAVWGKFLGEWVFELAVELDDESEVNALMSMIETTTALDYSLLTYFGKATAALRTQA